MAAGKILRSDLDAPIGPTELVALSTLFVGIQNNTFSKSYEPSVSQGLMEGLYLNSDPDIQSMMRMCEPIEIERKRPNGGTSDWIAPGGVANAPVPQPVPAKRLGAAAWRGTECPAPRCPAADVRPGPTSRGYTPRCLFEARVPPGTTLRMVAGAGQQYEYRVSTLCR